MSLTLNQITNEFLGKVKAIFPGLEVDHFPGEPEDYQFTHPRGAVLLLFRDRRFDYPQATDGTVQTNQPILALSYYTRNLRRTGRDEGMYDLLDKGREGIALNNAIGYGMTWCRREYLLRRRPGVWIFGQDWQLEDVFIADEQ